MRHQDRLFGELEHGPGVAADVGLSDATMAGTSDHEVDRLTRPPDPRHGELLAELAGRVVGVASCETHAGIQELTGQVLLDNARMLRSPTT